MLIFAIFHTTRVHACGGQFQGQSPPLTFEVSKFATVSASKRGLQPNTGYPLNHVYGNGTVHSVSNNCVTAPMIDWYSKEAVADELHVEQLKLDNLHVMKTQNSI